SSLKVRLPWARSPTSSSSAGSSRSPWSSTPMLSIAAIERGSRKGGPPRSGASGPVSSRFSSGGASGRVGLALAIAVSCLPRCWTHGRYGREKGTGMISGMPSARREEELDNPFWSSLRTRHRAIALFADDVARYPGDYAPFLGVAQAHARVDEALASLVAPGESVYLLGLLPSIPPGWRCEAFRPLAQMVCRRPLEVPEGPSIVALDERHRADALALTSLVYPHYFRPRTMELGRYFGIYRGKQLAAMAGERLGTTDTREMSAICTHPSFTGRGYARRLTATLGNDNLEHGNLPFLHVSHDNTRAL